MDSRTQREAHAPVCSPGHTEGGEWWAAPLLGIIAAAHSFRFGGKTLLLPQPKETTPACACRLFCPAFDFSLPI